MKNLGPITFLEIKSAIIFIVILGFWATDSIHGISATAVAFVGAIVALLTKNWNSKME